MNPDTVVRLFEVAVTASISGGAVWAAIRVDIANIHRRVEFLEKIAWETHAKK